MTKPNGDETTSAAGEGAMSRRSLLLGSGAGAVGLLGGLSAPALVAATARAQDALPVQEAELLATRALWLVNGKIHTMDDADRVVAQVLIHNGQFLAVGDNIRPEDSIIETMDLKGATVVPGLIEGHVHMMSLASRPGYHVVIERARDIAEIQQILADFRQSQDIPEDQFITALGGWHTNFFAERRLPTLQELDEALPDRAVLLMQGTSGPSVTNSLGKKFFESVSDAQAGPVAVAADGLIEQGDPSMIAAYHLRVGQTFEDKKRSTRAAMAYAASVGLTMVLEASAHGVHIFPLNPWPAIYYASTGLNSVGEMINDGQQISRTDALRLFTRANSWHAREEGKLGSIEKGKLADLVVLDHDMFNCTDEELRRIRPVLTIMGGKVVHDAKVI